MRTLLGCAVQKSFCGTFLHFIFGGLVKLRSKAMGFSCEQKIKAETDKDNQSFCLGKAGKVRYLIPQQKHKCNLNNAQTNWSTLFVR